MFIFKDPTTINEVRNALTKFNNSSSINRRTDMQKRLDFYFDNQEAYLKKSLEEQFKYSDRLKLQLEFFNCTSVIVNELSVIYSREPIREIIDGTDRDSEIYDKIIKYSNLNIVMQTANALTKLCKTVLVRVVWRNERVEFDIITPNIFDVIENKNDPKTADAIIYINEINYDEDKKYNNYNTDTKLDPFSKNNLIYNYWSKDKNIIFSKNNKEIEIKQIDTNPGDINPYKILPFLVIRDSYPLNRFFINGGDDLIKANEIINIKLTELNYLTKMQAFSIPVRKGAQGADQLILDPSMTIDIPADTDIERNSDFKFVTPDALIDEMSTDILNKLKRLAIKYKLDPEIFVSSAQKASGLALQLKNMSKSEFIEKDRPFYRIYEKELFNIIKTVHNYHSSEKISDNAMLYVDFKETEKPLTVEEKDNHNLLLYNNDIIGKLDWIMSENPDIKTREEAADFLNEIMEEKKKYSTEETDSFQTNLP